ncbi:hypothetical protein [Microvirga tunisiensis]|uniref:Uncharacterized protein n=1 Tax=Microvirga tunisiensis TaxID=2108360 RepID=A0A5N7MSR7_9HYPH|nr:hypothetical protein [Microvirga tunisiensis]MPR11950.1 hypothetical protein [Microvirga tunisiensis]MPR29908.1 hypothetical protein [Microvirga tunisiensis]
MRLVLYIHEMQSGRTEPLSELVDIVETPDARKAWNWITHQARQRKNEDTVRAVVVCENTAIHRTITLWDHAQAA